MSEPDPNAGAGPAAAPSAPARVRVRPGQVAAIAARPGFLVGHLVVVVLAVTTIWLGRWQWHAAHVHHGSVQNYAYAFQWWIFCAFGIAMWIRIMRDRAAREVETAGPVPSAQERHTAVRTAAAGLPSGYRPYRAPSSTDLVSAPAGDDADEVRRRYNAELAARYGRRT